jgi:hypothetical protein
VFHRKHNMIVIVKRTTPSVARFILELVESPKTTFRTHTLPACQTPRMFIYVKAFLVRRSPHLEATTHDRVFVIMQ